jgi:hypothetical protein
VVDEPPGAVVGRFFGDVEALAVAGLQAMVSVSSLSVKMRVGFR